MKLYELIVVGGLCALALGFISYQTTYGTEEIVTVTAKDKERVVSGDSGKYIIYTNGETFEDTDNWMYGKWNSSDFYGRIERGQRYVFTVVGYRVPMLSWYRNIVAIQEVPED